MQHLALSSSLLLGVPVSSCLSMLNPGIKNTFVLEDS